MAHARARARAVGPAGVQQISVRLPADLALRVRAMADASGSTLQGLVESALRIELARRMRNQGHAARFRALVALRSKET
jgi:hypothetical protein